MLLRYRKLLRRQDQAVSPVIAVILMVAITVVLAATVYVWVSGFGSSSGSAAKTISVTKTQSGNTVTYTVASATTGLRWHDLKFTVQGASTPYQIVTPGAAGTVDSSGYSATATLSPSNTGVIMAGDAFYVVGGATAISGFSVQILDMNANSVMATIPGGITTASSAPGATNLLSASGIARYSGTTANPLVTGSSRVTLSQAIDMSTLVVTDLSCDTASNGHVLGASTISVLSPTSFLINWGAGSTCATTDTLTLASGNVNGMTGVATTGDSTAALTNA